MITLFWLIVWFGGALWCFGIPSKGPIWADFVASLFFWPIIFVASIFKKLTQ